MKLVCGIRLYIICYFIQGVCGMQECTNGQKRDRTCIFCRDSMPEKNLECKGVSEVIDIKQATLAYISDCPPPNRFNIDDVGSCKQNLPLATCHGRKLCRMDVKKLFDAVICAENHERFNFLYVRYSCRKLKERKRMIRSDNPVRGSVVHLLSPDFPCDTRAGQEYHTVCQITARKPKPDTSVRLIAKLIELRETVDCSETLILRRNDEKILQICYGVAMNSPSLCLPFTDSDTTWYVGHRRQGSEAGGKFWFELEGIKSEISVSCEDGRDTDWLHADQGSSSQADDGLWINEEEDWRWEGCGEDPVRLGWQLDNDIWYVESNRADVDDASWTDIDYSWRGPPSDRCIPLIVEPPPQKQTQPPDGIVGSIIGGLIGFLLVAVLVGFLVAYFVRSKEIRGVLLIRK